MGFHFRACAAVIALGVALASAAAAVPARPSLPDTGSAEVAADSAAAAAETLAVDTLLAAAPRDYLAEMRAAFTPENRAYARLRVALAFIDPLYAALAGLLILFSGLSAQLRDIAHAVSRRRWMRVLVYFTLYLLVVFIVTFPVTWYGGFVIEHGFGLSNQSLGGWLADQGKELLVDLFFFGVVPVLWLAYTVIARSPRRWWLWLGLLALPLIVAGTLITPVVIDPLFNRFTPLRDPRLSARILDLAEGAGIPARHVYQVDKSEQTRKYNAYVTGFGASQRIVIWDTTLKGMKEDEILFVTGHEIGHYVLHHIWKGIVLDWLLNLVLIALTAWLAAWAVRRFGARWGFTTLDDVASLPLLLLIFSLLAFLAQPAVNAYSRHVETEADVYGLEITGDNDAAARAFLKLGAQNKSDPEPSAFVRFLLYSHPPLGERVKLALEYRPWAEGKPNRLYRGW